MNTIEKKKNNLFVNIVPDIIGLGKLALTPNEYFSNNSLEKQIVMLAIVWQPQVCAVKSMSKPIKNPSKINKVLSKVVLYRIKIKR